MDALREADPTLGRQSLERLRPTLVALRADELEQPRLDLRRVAAIVLHAVEVLGREQNLARLRALPSDLFDPDSLDTLRSLALAGWYARAQQESARAQGTASPELRRLAERGQELKRRMMRVLGYHLAEDAVAQRELASLGPANGYLELASSLCRLAQMYGAHAAALASDRVWYRASDGADAAALAEEMLRRMGEQDPLPDEIARIWTALSARYAAIRGVVGMVFSDAGVVAAVPSLHSAARLARRADGS